MSNIKIVIIDSGFTSHSDFNLKINGISFKYIDGKIRLCSDIKDNIGHGTAVTFLINKHFADADLFCIKIYEDEHCKPELLLNALDYIYKNIDCKIVNISLGVTSYSDLFKLREKCNKLIKKGIIIVSAFDNNGTLSYPAAFDNVIGVDVNFKAGNIKEFDYVENSPINIIGHYREQRLPWLNNSYQIVSGASFTAPYITAEIAKIISDGYADLSSINKKLKEKAKNIVNCKKTSAKQCFLPHKVIVFPFNKEIHSLARFYKNIKFEIQDFYDIKYTGNIGKDTKSIIGGNCDSDHIIKDYTKISWKDDFDTIILGHTEELSQILKINLKKYFLELSLKYSKNIICFDSVSENICEKFLEKKLDIYYPSITHNDIPKNQFGKLRKIGKPIVAITGTGPRQGKFTLQLAIKELLESSDYTVGMLGTEPTSFLFGSNEVFPMGYGSTVDVNGYNAIKVINSLLGKIEDTNPDIIIIGSQSQSTPFTDGALKYLPIVQHEFLLASAPDCYILCINLSDEINYIKRTIAYLESLFGSKVLALAALPLDHAQKWSVISNKKVPLDKRQIQKRKSEIKNAVSLDIYDISVQEDVIKLTEYIINYFSETN